MIFGLNKLPDTTIVLGGMCPKYLKSKVLKLFTSNKKVENDLFDAYLCNYNGKSYFLIIRLYGATKVLELVRLLESGETKNIIFIGWAGATSEINSCSVIIPKKVRCLDGVSNIADKNLKYSFPSSNLFEEVSKKLKSFEVKFLDSVSTPHILHSIKWIEKEQIKYKCVDMELGPLLFFSDKANINAVGVYITSNEGNKENISIKDLTTESKNKIRYNKLVEVLKKLI